MSDEYPLYPELTEQGKKEAQRIMDSFKPMITKLVEDILSDLYADVVYHVESDSWTNYRNALMDGFKGYSNRNHKHDFAELRKAIYENHKEQIVEDLNQDLVEEIENLKQQIKWYREHR